MERGTTFWRSRICRVLPEITAKHPNWRWLFVTFGVKDCQVAKLKETLFFMHEAFKRLRKFKAFPNCRAWVRFTELAKGQKGGVQIRFCCLFLVRPIYFSGAAYIKQSEWVWLWRRAMRLDYDPVVSVKKIDSNQHIVEMLSIEPWLDQLDFSNDFEWLVEYVRQLHKMRRISAGGILKGYLSELEKSENPIDERVTAFLDSCLRSQAATLGVE